MAGSLQIASYQVEFVEKSTPTWTWNLALELGTWLWKRSVAAWLWLYLYQYWYRRHTTMLVLFFAFKTTTSCSLVSFRILSCSLFMDSRRRFSMILSFNAPCAHSTSSSPFLWCGTKGRRKYGHETILIATNSCWKEYEKITAQVCLLASREWLAHFFLLIKPQQLTSFNENNLAPRVGDRVSNTAKTKRKIKWLGCKFAIWVCCLFFRIWNNIWCFAEC